MSVPQLEIMLIGCLVSIACCLPGTFLVLRKMAMMSDAISHTVLLGIVLAFLVTKNLMSPLLIIGAALMGIVTVGLVELLNATRLVKEDAAIGIVFPFLFSIAIVLISKYTGNVHLDTDVVLQGELAFAPFDRVRLLGVDIGAQAVYVVGVVLLINLIFIAAFYKELKLASFDPGLAAALGFSPVIIHYALMALVSLTVVATFEAVGSILVVALMIGPPATAYLITDRLSHMIGWSIGIGLTATLVGLGSAFVWDASLAGSIAAMIGILFTLVLLFVPNRGVIAELRRRKNQRILFASQLLIVHLFNHENEPEASTESRIFHLQDHFKWDSRFAMRVVNQAIHTDLIRVKGERLNITEHGREVLKELSLR